ncbi:DUF4232 domain-containing protein [Nonomuraea sp. NPDC049269]|uniref:DUF4232 domain-containing protein n=1 Tax=Nonomuraea sp. NPDC049269 TaxID=3364349 RepID=UPI0037155EB0
MVRQYGVDDRHVRRPSVLPSCALPRRLRRGRASRRAGQPAPRHDCTAADVVVPLPLALLPGSGTSLTAEEPNAAMGLRVQTVTLTNCGDKVRSVHGYPRVRLLDEAGEPLDIEIDRGARQITTAVRDPGSRTVTLRPGRSARFALVWRNTYGGTNHPPALGTTLVVGGHRIPGHFDLGSTGLLGITAWGPASSP